MFCQSSKGGGAERFWEGTTLAYVLFIREFCAEGAEKNICNGHGHAKYSWIRKRFWYHIGKVGQCPQK